MAIEKAAAVIEEAKVEQAGLHEESQTGVTVYRVKTTLLSVVSHFSSCAEWCEHWCANEGYVGYVTLMSLNQTCQHPNSQHA